MLEQRNIVPWPRALVTHGHDLVRIDLAVLNDMRDEPGLADSGREDVYRVLASEQRAGRQSRLPQCISHDKPHLVGWQTIPEPDADLIRVGRLMRSMGTPSDFSLRAMRVTWLRNSTVVLGISGGAIADPIHPPL